MPVYLSLLCWRPAVIRPSTVEDSTEKLSSLSKRDGASKANGSLRLVPIGCEANAYVHFKEETSKPSIDEQVKRKEKDGTDGTQHVVANATIEMGIQNEGIEADEEELAMNSTEGDNKRQNTSKESDLGQEEDVACTSEGSQTQKNNQVATPVPDDTTAVSKTDEVEKGSPASHDPETPTAKTGEVFTIEEKPPEAMIITNF